MGGMLATGSCLVGLLLVTMTNAPSEHMFSSPST